MRADRAAHRHRLLQVNGSTTRLGTRESDNSLALLLGTMGRCLGDPHVVTLLRFVLGLWNPLGLSTGDSICDGRRVVTPFLQQIGTLYRDAVHANESW